MLLRLDMGMWRTNTVSPHSVLPADGWRSRWSSLIVYGLGYHSDVCTSNVPIGVSDIFIIPNTMLLLCLFARASPYCGSPVCSFLQSRTGGDESGCTDCKWPLENRHDATHMLHANDCFERAHNVSVRLWVMSINWQRHCVCASRVEVPDPSKSHANARWFLML